LIGQALKQSLQIWWKDLVHLTLLHFLWVVCQLLIVTGPPATAALYILVGKVMDGELLSGRDIWLVFRAVFIPAWKWAACNLAVLGVLSGYLWWSRTQVGILADALSFLTLFALTFWLAANIYYWPVWLAQTDKSVRNTFRNTFVIVMSNPLSSAANVLICLCLTAVSVLTILPLIHLLMIWLVLFGINITQALIGRISSGQ